MFRQFVIDSLKWINNVGLKTQQKSNNSYEKNMEAKAMIKPFAKKEALLSRSDGVTMVGHDQAPNRCSYGSSQPGPQMKPWHLCRSSGMAMVWVRPSPQVILWP